MIKTTKILLLVVSIGLIGYDFVPFLSPERGDTISEVICYYGLRSISLPMVFGVLMGHFFMPVLEGAKQYPKALITIAIAAVSADVSSYTWGFEFIHTYPVLWFMLGLPIGALLWQQNRS